ncbi:Zn-dependent protease [Aureimonas sp. SA4125]|uniref:metallopeptidase family protein n=1 Tax=Aureimonas sp. SA4125 TaxID=2826993 RepID=UPI001CC69302|nr:metallopeptidase family protein [Aureimonas sp. SA4125]BDA86787.1 Zn-dependent protease [Aureimonas sp. SA4125]
MARHDQSGDWGRRMAPSLEEIEALALEAYAGLPQEFRRLSGDIQFIVADFPEDSIVEEMGLESAFDILGLFEGRPIGDPGLAVTGEMTNRILLYRRPILDYWSEHEEALGTLVAHVLIHEIGHHFGLSDDDMEELEAQAG